ncbi:NCS2 family permease [Isachenkonia alkalipeptolytica]|uniref:NCS2 family permease n=1 Tax=Isachenkonia alkalipeptolytica TaxID=2565777 RepID=UPI00191C21DF|nr:NCS2 family permease [Isachenkonia alkalipeptolytica]
MTERTYDQPKIRNKEKRNRLRNFFESFYQLSHFGTDIKTEITAGITTFLTMAYVLVVIPGFLADAGMPPEGLYTSVCLIAIIGTFAHAFVSKLPLATSPGLGLTIFFAYTVVGPMGYTWQQGLAAVTVSGMVFFIISITPARAKIMNSLPQTIKIAITGGIGLFIALIGFQNAGIVVAEEGGMYFGNLGNPSVLLSIIGLFTTLLLMAKGFKAALILSIAFTTVIGIPLGVTDLSGIGFLSMPPSIGGTFFQQDFMGLLGNDGIGFALLNIIMVILTISLVDLFDNIGTILAVADRGKLYNENGEVRNMKKALLCDSVSTTISSFIGTTTTSTYLECSAGIASGGKTGLTALTTGILFVVALFFSGIVGIIPGAATAPALIVIGILMMNSLTKLDFSDITEGAPAFFTIALMPFTSSIAEGIAGGIISYVILKVATRRFQEINPVMVILAILFVIRFMTL